MKVPVLISFGLAILIGGWMLSGQLSPTSNSNIASADELAGKQDSSVMKVQVEDRLAKIIERKVVILGQVEPYRQVSLAVEAAGRVKKLHAKAGHRVKAGQLLLQLAVNERKARLTEAEAILRQRQADFDAAKKMKSQGLQSQTNLTLAEAQLESAKVQRVQARLAVDHTDLRAPFNGVINENFIEVGSFVDRGDPIFILIDDSRLLVSGQVPQQNIRSVKLGQKAVTRFMDGHEVEGKITYISATGDSSTRSFRIEVEIPNDNLQTLAGISAEIRIPVERLPGHLLSPAMLALDVQGSLGVKAIDDRNVVRFFPVSIVNTSSAGAWVTGLPEQVRIITLGQGFVQSGDVVEPVFEKTPPSVTTPNQS
ncbi:MAG: efflux RND transporter periplasmic adaptor subunit [Gammaproteobacteria bacterium]|nr:efflux RND transporter periplasmic adaptor subunit [Gammaproteobacteria bacterium]